MSSSTGVDGRTYLENLVNVTYKSPDVSSDQYDFYYTLTSENGSVANGNGAAGFLEAMSQMGNVPVDTSQNPPVLEVYTADLFNYFSSFAQTGVPRTITDMMQGYVNVVNQSIASVNRDAGTNYP